MPFASTMVLVCIGSPEVILKVVSQEFPSNELYPEQWKSETQEKKKVYVSDSKLYHDNCYAIMYSSHVWYVSLFLTQREREGSRYDNACLYPQKKLDCKLPKLPHYELGTAIQTCPNYQESGRIEVLISITYYITLYIHIHTMSPTVKLNEGKFWIIPWWIYFLRTFSCKVMWQHCHTRAEFNRICRYLCAETFGNIKLKHGKN